MPCVTQETEQDGPKADAVNGSSYVNPIVFLKLTGNSALLLEEELCLYSFASELPKN